MSAQLSRMLASIMRRVRLIAARAVITGTNDASKMQAVQVKLLNGEVRDTVEHFQPYGFTSHPLPGAEGVYLSIGGDRDHGVVVVADDRRYRIKSLQPGELAIYTDEGDSIVMKRGHLVEVTTQTLRINAATLVEINTPKVQMNTPLVATTGNLQVDEDITDRKAHPDVNTVRGMRDLYDIHTHHENDLNGETNPPTQQT